MASVEPLAGGGARLRLEAAEAEVLRDLVRQLRALVGGGEGRADPVVERLFPPAYESAQEEREYRELVGGELYRHKLQLLARVEERLGGRGPAAVELGEEEAGWWLTVLTDLRLAIGTRLGVDEERMAAPVDPRDPQAPALQVLHWLGWVQENLLHAIGG